MKCYWINLDNRKDRASACEQKFLDFEFETFRVSAVTKEEVGILKQTSDQEYFQGIVACRMSHIKAMEIFHA